MERKTGAKERILNFLTRSAPELFNAGMIASTLSIKKETVKRTLSRLFNEGAIEKDLKGYYRGVVTSERMLALERTDIKIHGLKIEFQATDLIRENYRFVPFRGEGLSLCPLFNENELIKTDYWYNVYYCEFLGRWTKVTLHRGKPLVEVFLNCSSEPLDIHEFKQYRSWLQGRLGHTYDLGDPQLIQVGLNRDYETLRLDGCSSIKLQQWENAWQQIYNKAEKVLRNEMHITTRLKLDEAIEIMDRMGNVVRESGLDLKPSSDFFDYMYQ